MSELSQRFASLRAAWWPDIRRLIEDVVLETSGRDSMLWEMCDYQLRTGGKRLRALWPLRLAEVLDTDARPLLPFAAACELLHNASLVIDDIQDRDKMRRGVATLWKVFGLDQAINVSIAMLYYAVLLVDRLNVDAARRQEVQRWLAIATVEVAEGQCQDLALPSRERIGPLDYLRVAGKKTGAFVALPLTGTALLCGERQNVALALGDAARHVGMMFQLWNDITDLWGEHSARPRGNDIRLGKRSVLVLHCLEHAPDDERRWLAEILDRSREQTTDSNVADVIALLERRGSLRFAYEEMRRQRELARSQSALAGHPAARLVEELCTYLEALVALDVADLG